MRFPFYLMSLHTFSNQFFSITVFHSFYFTLQVTDKISAITTVRIKPFSSMIHP